MAAVEAGRLGEAEFLPADEEPGYREQWQQNRWVYRLRRLQNTSQRMMCQVAGQVGRRALTALHDCAGRLPLLLQWSSQRQSD